MSSKVTAPERFKYCSRSLWVVSICIWEARAKCFLFLIFAPHLKNEDCVCVCSYKWKLRVLRAKHQSLRDRFVCCLNVFDKPRNLHEERENEFEGDLIS